jgi:hypothetical protein
LGIYDRDWYKESQKEEGTVSRKSDRFTKGLITGLVIGFVIGFLVFGFI